MGFNSGFKGLKVLFRFAVFEQKVLDFLNVTSINGWHMFLCGPGSVVGIATGYGLDGPGIESRWGRDFLHLSRPALGPTQPPVQWIPCLSPGVKSGRGVTLIPHPLLVPLVIKEQNYTSTPPMGHIRLCTEPQCLYKGDLYLYMPLWSVLQFYLATQCSPCIVQWDLWILLQIYFLFRISSKGRF